MDKPGVAHTQMHRHTHSASLWNKNCNHGTACEATHKHFAEERSSLLLQVRVLGKTEPIKHDERWEKKERHLIHYKNSSDDDSYYYKL